MSHSTSTWHDQKARLARFKGIAGKHERTYTVHRHGVPIYTRPSKQRKPFNPDDSLAHLTIIMMLFLALAVAFQALVQS